MEMEKVVLYLSGGSTPSCQNPDLRLILENNPTFLVDARKAYVFLVWGIIYEEMIQGYHLRTENFISAVMQTDSSWTLRNIIIRSTKRS